jgi:sterol desaturase/sphingolipid hydroxylase (fatty acid hydroxylase superfamily)
MLAILLFLASAVFVDLAGYWLHRWAHRPWSPVYRPHMTHHVINYPPRSFFSTKYRASHSDGLALWFVPFGLVYVAVVLACDIPHPLAIFAGGGLVAALSSRAHTLTHISGSYLWRAKWLGGIAVRHHLHHFKMGRNFGILVPWWDGIFGTRRGPRTPEGEPTYRPRNRRRARRSKG